MRRVFLGIVALAVVGCTTACGTSTGGVATETTATATTTSQEPDFSLQRARTFDLSTVDPCALLTEAQRATLGATQPPSSTGDSGSPTCNFNSTTAASYAVFLDLTANAVETVGAVREKVTSTASVDGFDVALVLVAGQGCSSFINTGDSQYLSVQANGTGRVPDAELCPLAQSAAQMVIENLTVLQP